MSAMKRVAESIRREVHAAISKQTCVDCHEPFTDKNVHTLMGWKETRLSGMCEDCFDKFFGGES